MESHARTIVKTLTWRFIAIIITAIGAWMLNGGFIFAITLWANGIKTVFYYVHERFWNVFDWERKKYHETHLRTFVKTLSWKVVATVITMLVIYFYLGDFGASVLGGIGINLVKAILYYAHERVWNSVRWRG